MWAAACDRISLLAANTVRYTITIQQQELLVRPPPLLLLKIVGSHPGGRTTQQWSSAQILPLKDICFCEAVGSMTQLGGSRQGCIVDEPQDGARQLTFVTVSHGIFSPVMQGTILGSGGEGMPKDQAQHCCHGASIPLPHLLALHRTNKREFRTFACAVVAAANATDCGRSKGA
jgi:hypothetical protein